MSRSPLNLKRRSPTQLAGARAVPPMTMPAPRPDAAPDASSAGPPLAAASPPAQVPPPPPPAQSGTAEGSSLPISSLRRDLPDSRASARRCGLLETDIAVQDWRKLYARALWRRSKR